MFVGTTVNLTSFLLNSLLQFTPLPKHLGETLLKNRFILRLVHFKQELHISSLLAALGGAVLLKRLVGVSRVVL